MEYAVAPMSLAHTFGNVTAFITEYIKGLFPPNYFKTVNISSTIAYRYFNIFDNTNKEFIKKNKPMLIIRPRVDITDTDVFLNGTYLTSRITDNYMDLDFGNLQPFIRDPQKGLAMKFLLNRIKMNFDVTLIFETQMEQINKAMYLRNRVRQEHPFFIRTALESNIPRELMVVIAKEIGIDINNTKEFLDYINNNSCYPVTYKMKNSTGKDEFFRYYPVEIDTIFTGLSIDDGSKKGFVSDAYAVNFTVGAEFYTSGLYYYFTQNKEIIEEIQFDIITNDKTIVPIFTISNLFDVETPVGWNLYTAPMFKVEHDKLPDTLDLKPLLNHSLTTTIQYHLEKGIPMDSAIRIVVLKDNEKLDPAANEYTVDYENLTLTTYKTNKTSTYRLIIFVNTLYINNLIADLYDISNEK